MRRILQKLRKIPQYVPQYIDVPYVPAGHFYSPIADTAALAAEKDRLWPPQPHVAGIDWNDDGHRRMLTEIFPRFIRLYDYPELLPDGPQLVDFYTGNPQFSWLDARSL